MIEKKKGEINVNFLDENFYTPIEKGLPPKVLELIGRVGPMNVRGDLSEEQADKLLQLCDKEDHEANN